MRPIDDYFEDIPESLGLPELLRSGIAERIINRTKRVESNDYNRLGVKDKLLFIYAHCCAFCEKRVGKYDDIEHFRPKHAITGVNTEGYYWLGFVWSNLLIACPECNRDAKKNHFPIAGTRMNAHMPIDFTDMVAVIEFFRRNHIKSLEHQDEQHILLHPVLDNPDDYLVFEMNGTVTAKNDNIRGLTSIQYYGLSDWQNRKILIQDRKKIVEKVRNDVYHAIDNYVNDMRLYQDLRKIHLKLISEIQSKTPFSAVKRSCLTYFKVFFIDIFTGEQESHLNCAYERLLDDFR